LTRLSPNFVKPMMPRHSMTLSRHQNKLLQTPATLETLGSISAVMEDVACEMYVLINQLTLVCNMQWNVLDDLAEAMKALDGKKWKMLHANRPCG